MVSHSILLGGHTDQVTSRKIGAETLRIARASSNPDCFSLSIKPLVIRTLKQGACKEKLNNVLCKVFNKHQNDFQYVARTTQEPLA